jgi:hypothetical protein
MRARYAALVLLALAGCTRAPVGRGKSAYVFVATTCPISNRALPEIARVAARFAGRVDVTLVYPDDREDEVAAHRASYGVTLPSTRDPTHKLVAAAHATVTPEAALFRDGALVWHGRIDDRYSDVAHERPAATTHDFEDALAALADGRALPPAQAAVGCVIPSTSL